MTNYKKLITENPAEAGRLAAERVALEGRE